jgi:hypothetical protein
MFAKNGDVSDFPTSFVPGHDAQIPIRGGALHAIVVSLAILEMTPASRRERWHVSQSPTPKDTVDDTKNIDAGIASR